MILLFFLAIALMAANFATAFSFLSHYMGPGPFAAGTEPCLGDCAAVPFILLLKATVFPYFEEIPDPTETDERLQRWWQAINEHAACKAAADEYDDELKKFLLMLEERLRKMRESQ